MDSSSNRSVYRSPTPKVARYLHRIQQIMGNRCRTPSPISSRVHRSLKPSSLDHYLKYQLTFKILITFVDNKIKDSKRIFFNNLRTVEKHKVEKIYRFVSIQKLGENKISVDSNIAAKILINYLRSLFRLKKKQYFDQIHSYRAVHLIESHLIINRKDSNNNEKILKLYMLVDRKILQQYFGFLNKLNIIHNSKQKQQTIPKSLIKQKTAQNLKEQNKKMRVKIIFQTINILYMNLLKICLRNCKNCVKTEDIYTNQIYSLFSNYHKILRKQLLLHVKLALLTNNRIKNRENIESSVQLIDANQKQSKLITIFQFSLKIQKIKHTIKYRILDTAFKQMKINKQYHYQAIVLVNIISKQIIKKQFQAFKLLQFYAKLSSSQMQKKSVRNSLQKFIQIKPYVKIYKQSFNNILITSTKKGIIYDGLFLLQELCRQIIVRQSFYKIIDYRKQRTNETKTLFKMLNKLFSIRVIESFSKIKVKSFSQQRPNKNFSEYWLKQANSFLEERKKNEPKIQRIWDKIQKLAEDTQNRGYEKNNQLKIAISPSNHANSFKFH